MSIVQSRDASGDDAAAIAEVKAAFAAQKRAFEADRSPSLAERAGRIQALMGVLVANRGRIAEAVAADFGAHPAAASDLLEVLSPLGRAQYALEHLESWMQPSERPVDPTLFGTGQARMLYQPKGVVGNMSPWNFPIELAVGPMIEMLAAGNRVMLKPSDLSPACSALLKEMMAQAFDPDLVYVAVGGLELSKAFADLPLDHLLYTGAPGVGRQVMAAAARNLTPVTLELGGKCPALLAPGAVDAASVESVIGTKVIKNGQMCVTVDYCLVPRADVDRFVELAGAWLDQAAPSYAQGAECAGIISERHLARLQAMLDQARQSGARVITLQGEAAPDPVTRRMPISLVINPSDELDLMRDEIFGPILPVIPYDTLDEALARINTGDRPLGLYVFSGDQAEIDRVIGQTSSGGVAVNTCAAQSALPALGFGGSGLSGMGRHHSVEGFREFSNPRGLFVRGEGDMIDVFYPPYAKAAAVAAAAIPG